MAEKKKLDSIQLNLLREVADLHGVPEGAYSLRVDGEMYGKNSSENIIIEKKTDKPGIDIYIKAGTKRESVRYISSQSLRRDTSTFFFSSSVSS